MKPKNNPNGRQKFFDALKDFYFIDFDEIYLIVSLAQEISSNEIKEQDFDVIYTN